MATMKIETRIEKFGALKAERDALDERLEAMKKELIEAMEAEGIKKAESKTYKVTLTLTDRATYKDDVFDFLRKVAPKAIKETVDAKNLNALLKAEVITESELNKYREIKVSKSVLIKNKD